MPKRKYHYVYALIDPRSLKPFYIGKGTGDRRVQHFQNVPKWMAGEEGSAKHRQIQEIKAAGLKPLANVVSHHPTDDEALDAEKKLIESIGLEHLTNENAGGGGDKSRAAKAAAASKPLTAKQEQFAQLVALGNDYTSAYREAYSAEKMSEQSIYVTASRLKDNPKVALRIEALKQPALERHEVDMDYLIAGFKRTIELADETGAAAAMATAFRELGRLKDLYPAERKQIDVTLSELGSKIRGGRERMNKRAALLEDSNVIEGEFKRSA